MTGLKTIINGLKTWVSTRKIDENQIPDSIARVKDIPQGSVQADLAQNDPEAPDYVKSRTHWVESGEVVFLDNAIVDSSTRISMSLIAGETYTITFDGVEYTRICNPGEGLGCYIGNIGIVNMGADNGDPFFIAPVSDDQCGLAFKMDGSHTMTIKGVNENIHKIDEKFLPYIAGKKGSGLMAEVFNGAPSGQASGDYSHAEGVNTTASGDYSHAEGVNTVASEQGAHAEGSHTTASGHRSHAEGEDTTASGYNAHSEGNNTTASGRASHAEGANTTAKGEYGHAEGVWTEANGMYSHAEGYMTIAPGMYQHVQGKSNISSTKYAHIVGNGNNDNRSNAHTLDWDGNAWYAGDIYIGSTSGTNKDEGSRKLIPSPTTLITGSLLMYDGTDWVSITKEALIEEIIAALPTWTGGSY